MYCNNCGMELAEGALFCSNCGAKVAEMPKPVDDEDKTVLLGAEELSENIGNSVSETDERSAGQIRTTETGQTAENTSAEIEQQSEPVTEKVEAVEIPPMGVVETNEATLVQAGSFGQKKFCPNCGTEVGVNDLFCQSCGMFFGDVNKALQGNAAQKINKNKIKKVMPIVAAAIVVIVLCCVFVPGIFGGGGSKENQKDYLLYIKDNELIMADGSKFEPLLIDDRFYKDKDSDMYIFSDVYFFNGYYYPGCMFDNKYIYYPRNIDSDDGADLYRKKLGDMKAEAEKIDSNVISCGLIDNDKILYFKGGIDDGRMYIYSKGETNKVASDVSLYTMMIMISEDKKNVIWRNNDGDMYVQDTDLKADKIKLDSDVSEVYAYSDDLDVIVYRKDDNLYILKDLEDKEKIASDVEEVYVYGINNNLRIYYMKIGDEEKMSAYDFIEDDYPADENMEEPRIEDYQTITYVNDWFGTREKIETSDSYYDALDEYDRKLTRDAFRYDMQNITMSIATKMEVYHYDSGNDESDKVMEASTVQYGNLGTDTALMYLWTADLEDLERPKLSRLMEDNYSAAWEEGLESSLAECMQLQYIKDGEVFEVSGLRTDIYTGWYIVDDTEDPNEVYGLPRVEAYLDANEKTHTMYLNIQQGENCELYSFDYNASEPDMQLVSDDEIRSLEVCDEGIYYINEDDELYCNQTKIDSDVYAWSVRSEDGMVLYLTDINKDHDEGTLKLYQGDKPIKIADDVAISRYRFFDGNKIVFMSDYNFNKNRGDLSVYDGKEVIKADSDVQLVFICH